MSRLAPPLLLLFLGLCAVATGLAGDRAGYVLHRSDSPFEDVLDGLKAAIQERGLYINNVMDIGAMLDRTGEDLGMDESIYVKARSVEFCSALLSREMTLEDPARIINCPFIIGVYQRADEPDATYLVHRAVPAEERAGSPAMTKVARMLEELSAEAISW